jgi:hypothetical protein
VDWLLWGKEAASIMADYWKTIDTVLMGRKTYEVAVWSGKGGALRVSRQVSGLSGRVHHSSQRVPH